MVRTRPLSKRGIFLSVSLVSGVALILAVQAAADGFLSNPVFLVRGIEVVWPRLSDAPRRGTSLDRNFAEAAPGASALWPQEPGGRPDQFRLSPPTSIFRIDLASLSQAFQQRYPAVEVQEIRRLLPDRMIARMRFRRTVAQVKQGGRYFAVGDNGTIVANGQSGPLQGLPLLGLEDRLGPLDAGASIADTDFWKVSALLSTLQRGGGVAGRPVKIVRVEGPDLRLVLESGPEIRLACDRLAAGWIRLGELMVGKRDLLESASYIDVRFEDPVIGERKAKGRGKR